jgi:hypothetical protein
MMAVEIIDVQAMKFTAGLLRLLPLDVRKVSDLPGNEAQRFRPAPALQGHSPDLFKVATRVRPQAFRTSGGRSRNESQRAGSWRRRSFTRTRIYI